MPARQKLEVFNAYSISWNFDALTYEEKRKRIQDPYEFILQGYGLAKNGDKYETVFMKITGFTPYVYIELPSRDCKGKGIEWNKGKVETVKHYVADKLKHMCVADIEFMRKKTMKSYSTKAKNVLKVSFTSQDVVRDVKFKFQSKGKSQFAKLNVMKMDKDDLLDLLDLLPEEDHPLIYSMSQSFKGVVGDHEHMLDKAQSLQKIIDSYKRKDEKVIVNQHTLTAVSKNPFKLEVFEDWVDPIIKFMSVTKNSPTGWKTILGVRVPDSHKDSTCTHEFDVEWDKISAFPCSEVVCPKICSLDIETASSRYKQSTTGVTAGSDPYRVKDDVWMAGLRFNRFRETEEKSYVLTTRNCHPKRHKESTVLKFDSEATMLLKMRDIILEEDPDIILGHNILGFDLDYLAKRAGYDDGVRPKTEADRREKALTLEKNAIWSEFSQLGRLKDHQCRFVKNSWSSGAYKGMNFQYIDINGRLLIDTLPYCKRSYPTLESHKLDFLSEKFLKENKEDISYTDMWGIADRNIAKEVDKVIVYQEQDTRLPMKIFYKINIWIDLTEISKVVNLPIFELYTRGQSRRGLAQIYKKAQLADIGYMLDLPEPKHTDEDDEDEKEEKYQGAYVHTPVPGVYTNVITLDFASLYPSMIRAYNLDYTTFVDDPDIPDDMCHVIEWTDAKSGEHYRFRFIKQEYHRGILPEILDEFTEARAETNAEKKKFKHPEADKPLEGYELEYSILDSRQKELKVSSNSAYGITGFRKGRLCNMPSAMCTTAMGRMSIEKVMKYLVEKYDAEIVYGDTDSAMFRVPKWDYTQSYDNGPKIAAEISAVFPKPMKLEWEKIFEIFVILKKKMYAGLIFNRDKTKLIMFMKKGLITQRRDYCKYAKETYDHMLEMILRTHSSYEDIEQYVIDRVKQLMSGQVGMEALKLRKTYNPPYKAKIAHAILAENMKAQGHDVQAGDIIYYVFVEREGAKKVSDRVQDPVIAQKQKDKLDVVFYLESQMSTRVVDLLDSVFPKVKKQVKRQQSAYDKHGKPTVAMSSEQIPYVKNDTIITYKPASVLMSDLLSTTWKRQIVNTHLNLLFKKTGYTERFNC